MASPCDPLQLLIAQVAALTARVYQLEQKAGTTSVTAPPTVFRAPEQSAIAPPPASPSGVYAAPTPQAPPPPQFIPPRPALSPIQQSIPDSAAFEKKIGQYWLNRVGIAAILIGVSYFVKLAFENNWIGPSGRIAIGIFAGIALVIWSERFRKHGHVAFSYSLKAVGVGTLYLSLWGAYQVYHLIPASAAFVAMIVVTASTIALAVAQDAELLASFALVGGFATPVLLSTGQNHEVVLFTYVGLLDLAILVAAHFKPWRRLLWIGFAGTILLYFGWNVAFYNLSERPLTICFAAMFVAIFAVVPLLVPHNKSTIFRAASVTLTVLPLLNAGAFFLALFVMYASETVTLTWYALALAAIYLGLNAALKKREASPYTNVVSLIHVAIAIAFLTIAIPLKLNAQWITIGWLVESAILLWISVTKKVDFLRYFGIVALGLGICRLLFFDQFNVHTLLFNPRFATYLVAIAVLGGIALFGRSHASEKEKSFIYVDVVLMNLMALIAMTLEASDYFSRQVQTVFRQDTYAIYRELSIARDFSFSAIWFFMERCS